jgi:hypothetical protein
MDYFRSVPTLNNDRPKTTGLFIMQAVAFRRQRSFMSLIWFFCLVLFAGASLPCSARAEFLKTSPGVYQNQSGMEKIIVSYAVPGIFVISGPPVDLQLFDPGQLSTKSSFHAFLEYSPQNDSYTALIVGPERYKINGNFTLDMGRIRLAVDNNNPYLSIVVEKESAILGFRGLEPVVNLSGETSVAFLEANQFNPYGDAIAPYALADGRLLLRGAAIQRDSIGLKLDPPRNPCLDRNKVIYIDQDEIERIKKITDNAERLKRLGQKLNENKNYNPLAESLLAGITKDSLVALNYQDGSVKSIKPMKNKFAKTTICVVDQLEL